MIIDNKEDFLNFLNKEEELILNNMDFYFNSIVEIGENPLNLSPLKIIGSNSSISAIFIINKSVIFDSIDFYGFENIIINYSRAELTFINCNFYSYNKGTAITTYKDSKSSLTIKSCSFTNFNTAININNNFLITLENSTFQNCDLSTVVYNEDSLIDSSLIKNNFNLSLDSSIFIKILNFIDESKVLTFINTLSFNNNYSRIFASNSSTIFDSKSFLIYSYEELLETIKTAPNSALLFLDSIDFFGDILIEKPLTLIGSNSTKFFPKKDFENSAAFIINSSFVNLKNFSIGSFENLSFRDGIRFESLGGSNCSFINLNLSNINRRAISLWGENTNNSLISYCNFYNILGQSAIDSFNNLTVTNCNFENCFTALSIKFFGDISLNNNNFKYINRLIYSPKTYTKKISLQNNNLYFVKKLLES